MADQIPRLRSGEDSLQLRPAQRSDEAVLVRIFAEAHCASFAMMGLEPAALAGLVDMQYRARQGQYRASHPEAAEYLLCIAGDPVGSCWLDDAPGQLRVLDIAVLGEHRRRGLARAVLGDLCVQAGAAGKPVRLSVWHENVAARELYRSLGFTAGPAARNGLAEDGELGNGYLELELLPDRAPRPRADAR